MPKCCTNYENQLNNESCNNFNEKKSNIKSSYIISILSIVIFSAVIILNIIFFYNIKLYESSGGNSLGLGWLYIMFGLPTSISGLGGSLILAIISIYKYFKDRKIQLKISNTRTILVSLNIIQIILSLNIFLFFKNFI